MPRKHNEANSKKVKKLSKTEVFLRAVIDGADPITGEVLKNDSAWKHPKIISDIKTYLEDNENPKKKPITYLSLAGIKDWVKRNHEEVDIVLIQQGFYFAVFDEDAILLSVEFNTKTYKLSENSSLQTGFPTSSLKDYIERFEERNYKYVVIEQTGSKHSNGRMIRKITSPEVLVQEKIIF